MATKHMSPSGKYWLSVESIKTKEGCWNFSYGKVNLAESGEYISVIHRNYSAFPFAWAEGHPDGHDYLLCGEDYQGYTVIQLDTGLRRDYLPKAANQGAGWCWIEIEPIMEESPRLKVYGCYWAFPYEYIIYDFSRPMEVPYTELERWLEDPVDEEDL